MGLAVVLPILAWEKHGAVIGILAVLVLGGVFLAAAFDRPVIAKSLAAAGNRWSPGRAALDAALGVPVCFLALAASSNLLLVDCAVGALLVGALVVPVGLWRDRRRSLRSIKAANDD